jgi:hypothetical protein
MIFVLHWQLFPQSAGAKVKAELKGNSFPVGVPVKAQVPHSCVDVQPVKQKPNNAIRVDIPKVLMLICVSQILPPSLTATPAG